jgi:hypothetical protein
MVCLYYQPHATLQEFSFSVHHQVKAGVKNYLVCELPLGKLLFPSLLLKCNRVLRRAELTSST